MEEEDEGRDEQRSATLSQRSFTISDVRTLPLLRASPRADGTFAARGRCPRRSTVLIRADPHCVYLRQALAHRPQLSGPTRGPRRAAKIARRSAAPIRSPPPSGVGGSIGTQVVDDDH